LQVTNQMITACKKYITETEARVWEQDRTELRRRLNICKELNACYQRSFAKEKEKLAATPDRRQFDFSEMSIFGKFDTFTVRADRILEVLDTMESWDKLSNSKIDGIAIINANFRSLVTNLKKRPPESVLDIRKTDFDNDYDQFKKEVDELLSRLIEIEDTCFQRALHAPISRTLTLLEQFEKVCHVGLDLGDKYEQAFTQFAAELDTVQAVYQRNRNDPEIGRNLPPLAGRIIWARQLFGRIEMPMSWFQKHAPERLKAKLKKPAGAKVVKQYNRLGHVLMEFELLYHRAWWQAVDAANTGMQASLFVRHPTTNRLVVNLDKQILQLIRETKSMQKLRMEIPESAHLLCLQEANLLSYNNQLRQLAARYDEVLDRVPEVLATVLAPSVAKVDDFIKGGVTHLTWMSANLRPYLDGAYAALDSLDASLSAVDDVISKRINSNLAAISAQTLLPEQDAPWDPTEFTHAVEAHYEHTGRKLEKTSRLLELAVVELMSLIKAGMTPAQVASYSEELEELYAHYHQQCNDALMELAKGTLDGMKRKCNSKSNFFVAKMSLDIPNVTMDPSLDDVQKTVSKVAGFVRSTFKYVYAWGQDRSRAEDKLTTLYSEIGEHKEVAKASSALDASINGNLQAFTDIVAGLQSYSRLWEEKPEEKLAAFLASSPDLYDFEDVVKQYEAIEKNVAALPASFVCGPISLDTALLKTHLTAETTLWKQMYGKGLNEKAAGDMTEVLEFCEDIARRLNRKVADLEDVREAMLALKELREMQITMDNKLGPIEQAYSIIGNYGVIVPRSESERLDALRFQWDNMMSTSASVQDHLIEIQGPFKVDLLEKVKVFNGTVATFVSEYDISGPMAIGITPAEASDRVQVYQARFDDVYKKYVTYTGGEELFGLPQSQYEVGGLPFVAPRLRCAAKKPRSGAPPGCTACVDTLLAILGTQCTAKPACSSHAHSVFWHA